jgi:hypothetical protein
LKLWIKKIQNCVALRGAKRRGNQNPKLSWLISQNNIDEARDEQLYFQKLTSKPFAL